MLVKNEPSLYSENDYLRVVWSSFFEYMFPASGPIKIKTGETTFYRSAENKAQLYAHLPSTSNPPHPKFQFTLPSTIADLDSNPDVLRKLLTFRSSIYSIADTIEESLANKHSVGTALRKAYSNNQSLDSRIYWIRDSYYTPPSHAKPALPTYLFGCVPPPSILNQLLSLSHEVTESRDPESLYKDSVFDENEWTFTGEH